VMRRNITTIIAAACASFAIALPARSHDHASGVVKQRMDMMEVMAKRTKAIRGRIEGKRDFSAIKADAEVIASHASHIVHLFPPGSTQLPTDATPAIWQNWADFERKAAALETESKKLVNAEPNNFDAIGAQLRAVSETCSACHEKYRTKSRTGDT